MFNASKFYKHIFLNLLLITLVIISISFTLFISSKYKASKASLEQSYITQAEQITTTIDYKLQSGINLINELSVNKATRDFINLKSFDPSLTLDFYNHIRDSASLIYNLELIVGVYNDNLGLIISNDSSSVLESFLVKYKLTENKDLLRLFDNDSNKTSFQNITNLIYTDDQKPKYLLHATRKTHLPNQPLSFIVYTIDSLINDVTNNDTISDFSITLKDSPEDLESSKANSNNVLVIDSKSFPLRYTLKFDSPKSNVSLDYLLKAILGFIALIIFMLFLIYIFSNKVYIPVEKLIKSTIDPGHVELIKDEFMYIQNHVVALKDKINVYTVSGRDILLKEILYGIKKDNIGTLLTDNNISLFSKECFMIVINSNKDPNITLNHLNLKSWIELKLSTQLDGLTEYNNYKFINISTFSSVLFLNTILRNDAQEFLNNIPAISVDYKIIITEYIQSDQISNKFDMINELFKNDTLDNPSSVVLEENITLKSSTPYVYTESDRKLIIYNVVSGNEDNLLVLLNKILNENLFNRKLALQTNNAFLSEICSTLTSISSEFKDTTEVFDFLTTIADSKDLKVAIKSLFNDYFLHVNTEDNISNDRYNFLDYIHNNHDQDISLTNMANEFNLAVNYVGVVFKESTGFNFKEYLNTYRINVSKQILLETPNIKIKDLAISVGFSSANTFIRTFKNLEDITPGQYRKHILHTNRDV